MAYCSTLILNGLRSNIFYNYVYEFKRIPVQGVIRCVHHEDVKPLVEVRAGPFPQKKRPADHPKRIRSKTGGGKYHPVLYPTGSTWILPGSLFIKHIGGGSYNLTSQLFFLFFLFSF